MILLRGSALAVAGLVAAFPVDEVRAQSPGSDAAAAQPTPTPTPGQPSPGQPTPVQPSPGQPTPVQPTPVPPPTRIQHTTLGQVLEVAVRQQPELAQATIDVEIADAAVLQAAGIDDWNIAVTGSWSSSRIQALQLDQTIISGQVDLVRALPTGGLFALRASSSFTDVNSDAFGDRSEFDDQITATLNHPLLRGRGKRIARAQNRQAAIARDVAALQRQSAAVNAISDVIRAYWELAFAIRDLDIRKSSLALALEQLRNTRAAIEAGAVAPTEALAVEQSIAQREEEILAAELAISERSLDLRRAAGLEIGPGAIDLTIEAALVMAPEPLDFDALLARALEQSPTIAALERQTENDQIEVEISENGLLPELDLGVSFGPAGTSDTAGDALKRMAQFDDLRFNASLTLRHAFGRRTARGGHRRARAQLQRARIDARDARAQIATALVRAVKAAELAEKRYQISERTIALSEKNIEAEQARFELGRATNFDVLQRQEELKRAQFGQARAVVDYLQARAVIDALTGDLLGKYGVSLEP